MTKRVITNIGDVFCAKINNYKIYLQYVANMIYHNLTAMSLEYLKQSIQLKPLQIYQK